MIKYAGIDLVLDDKYQSLQRYLEGLGASAVPKISALDELKRSWPGGVTFRTPEIPEIGINQLFWPTGIDRPAIGHFLITEDIYSQLNWDAPVRKGLGPVSSDALLEIDTEIPGALPFSRRMWVVAITPIFVTDSSAPLYLLTLGDGRWRMWTHARTPNSLARRTIEDAMGQLFVYRDTFEDSIGRFSPSQPLPSTIAIHTLPDRWQGFHPATPPGLIGEVLANSVGYRWVSPLRWNSTTRDGYFEYWTPEKEAATWEAIKDRVATGGRIPAAMMYRSLPSFYRDGFGLFTEISLSTIAGQTVTGNGLYAHVTMEKGESQFIQTVTSNWVRNHFSLFSGVLHGIAEFPLHAGIDYLLMTHQVDKVCTEVHRWGSFYRQNFVWDSVPSTRMLVPGIRQLQGFECDGAGNIIVHAQYDWFVAGAPMTFSGIVTNGAGEAVSGVTIEVTSKGYTSEFDVVVTATTDASGSWSTSAAPPPLDSDLRIVIRPLGGTFTPADRTYSVPFNSTTSSVNFVQGS